MTILLKHFVFKKRTFLGLVLLNLLLPGMSFSQTDPIPAEVSKDLRKPVFIGAANLTVFMFFDVYDATLWATKEPWDLNQKSALSLVYNRAFSQEELVDTSLTEMARYDDVSAQAADYKSQLEQILPDVSVGDRITAVYDPGKDLEFYYNGRSIGRLTDPVFAKRYIEIWLHPNAYYADFRREIVGGSQ